LQVFQVYYVLKLDQDNLMIYILLIHTDRESLLIIEFRSFVFRDRLLFLRCPTDEEFIVSFLPLCRLTISPITRRSECREKAIMLCFDTYQTFVNTFIKQKKKKRQ
jgi:hypothetical protein